MPMIAFGSYNGSYRGCTVEEGVLQWLKLGGRHVDAAHMYETEADVGAAVKASGVPREEIFLTTKIPGPIGRNATHQMILTETLPKLGMDYVDLVLIHYPCADLKDFPNKCGAAQHAERLDTWRGLQELRSAGKIRAIGVSNYNAEQVEEVIQEFKEVPAVNQAGAKRPPAGLRWHESRLVIIKGFLHLGRSRS
ncbi:9 [Durusdinium trenchii]|uniref:11-endoperoxide prostaglandin H2 reductase (Prostaglandin F2-alpha synthase) n=1 Tax=Durusdinium trenchii TaxID=1381693 RepID=A0ABP0Q1F3_9DINO